MQEIKFSNEIGRTLSVSGDTIFYLCEAGGPKQGAYSIIHYLFPIPYEAQIQGLFIEARVEEANQIFRQSLEFSHPEYVLWI